MKYNQNNHSLNYNPFGQLIHYLFLIHLFLNQPMQYQFSRIYQDIKDNTRQEITGLWLIFGDEPLTHQWFIDVCRPVFANNHQLIKRFFVNATKDWDTVLLAVNHLSLFDDKTVAIVEGKARPTNELLAQLTAFSQNAHQNAIIYTTEHQDKKAQAGKLFQVFSQYGTVIDAQIYNENIRSDLLNIKAVENHLDFSPEAWRFLLTHTENNILSAHQAIMRLSNLYINSPKTLEVADIMPTLVSDYHYSVFNLCDMLLQGDFKALQILQHLKNTNTAPSLVLWGLAREIGLVLRIVDGQPLANLGIWRNKLALYQSAAHSGRFKADMLNTLYAIDKSIKGLNNQDSWQELEMLCLQICRQQQPQLNKYRLI